MKNPLSFLTHAKKEDKVEASVVEANARAQKCLSMPEFEVYRKRFEEVEASIVGELIALSANFDGNIEGFGAKCLAKLTRLRTLRALLASVNSDKDKK
jgi:hypothetical protein